MATFNAFPETYRSSAAVHRNSPSGPVFRGSAVGHEDFTSVDTAPALIHKDAAFIDTAEEHPPALPYPAEFCSTNTYASGDCSLSPQELRKQIIRIVEKISVDVTASSGWDFTGVFYPEESRTVFKVSVFDDVSADKKNSCLIEMQLQEGERVAFQGLCSYVQSQTGLVPAFEEEWGFGDTGSEEEEEDDEWESGYKHRSFAPLPLPLSLCSDLDEDITETDEDLSPLSDEPTRGGNCLLDVLLSNTCSPFADVRRAGWQELAKATNETAIAEALLKARVDGEDGIELAAAALRQNVTCDVTADTQRCIMKTLLNVAQTGTVDGCSKICRLKAHIVKLANKTNPIETRSVAVQLMQCLLKNSGSGDADYVRAIRACDISDDNCRVSCQAHHALKSLKLVSH